jgi:CRISPR/Cas system-associated protein Cas5 (RAMP superfamily)
MNDARIKIIKKGLKEKSNAVKLRTERQILLDNIRYHKSILKRLERLQTEQQPNKDLREFQEL